MDYLNRSERYRMPPFDCVKPTFKESPVMMPLKGCTVFEGYPFFQQKMTLGHAGAFQPPRFIVGGFVGSKVCEHKSGSAGNYSDLLGTIINILTTFKPAQPNPAAARSHSIRGSWPYRNSYPSAGRTYAEVTTRPPLKSASVPSSSPAVPEIMIEKASTPSPAMQKTSPPASVPPMRLEKEKMLSPAASRTLSESSDTSWASTEPSESHNLPSTNPWLKNMLVCVADSASDDDDDDDSEDSDSEWDCVSDFQSENGEIISDFKWHHGECLSPITSPTTKTPPAVDNPDRTLIGYDSDEDSEGGVYISCIPYGVDEEEEARERRAAEERLQAVNQRWEEGLAAGQVGKESDEPDAKTIKKTAQGKQVQFAAKLTHVRPMVTWSHAYRNARKGDWERLARDADRFRERIESTAAILSPVLDPEHRERIRRKRMETDESINCCC